MPKLRRFRRRRLTSGFCTVSSMATKAVEHGRGDHGQLDDEGRLEPVVLVAFLEHGLQRREPDRHGDDAGPVALLEQRQLHRRLLQREGERDDHDDAGRQC